MFAYDACNNTLFTRDFDTKILDELQYQENVKKVKIYLIFLKQKQRTSESQKKFECCYYIQW